MKKYKALQRIKIDSSRAIRTQETIEEAANREYPHALCDNDFNIWQDRKKQEFIKGAKFQAERSYSKEELIQIVEYWSNYEQDFEGDCLTFEEWLKHFKKEKK